MPSGASSASLPSLRIEEAEEGVEGEEEQAESVVEKEEEEEPSGGDVAVHSLSLSAACEYIITSLTAADAPLRASLPRSGLWPTPTAGSVASDGGVEGDGAWFSARQTASFGGGPSLAGAQPPSGQEASAASGSRQPSAAGAVDHRSRRSTAMSGAVSAGGDGPTAPSDEPLMADAQAKIDSAAEAVSVLLERYPAAPTAGVTLLSPSSSPQRRPREDAVRSEPGGGTSAALRQMLLRSWPGDAAGLETPLATLQESPRMRGEGADVRGTSVIDQVRACLPLSVASRLPVGCRQWLPLKRLPSCASGHQRS